MARDPRDRFRDSAVFGTFAGIRNTVSNKRLASARVGEGFEPVELEGATNVDIDDTLQVRRRRGFTKKVSGDYHSAWSGDTHTFVVKDGALGVVYPDFTFSEIFSGVGPRKLAYVQVADTVYFSGEGVSGKILGDLTYAPWGRTDGEGEWVSPVLRPTQYLGEIWGRSLAAPPQARYLAEMSGRIYLAHESLLWATEFFMFDHVDPDRNYMQFESEIAGLGAVEGGMYVATRAGTYYIAGQLSEMQRKQVDTYNTIPGSMIQVDPRVLGDDGQGEKAVIYMTDQGVCAGLSGGSTYNITKKRVIIPDATSAASLFREQDGINQYIGVTDTGGTPSSKARIGDYVEAEIRRFQGA